jgi:hypothetical protein
MPGRDVQFQNEHSREKLGNFRLRSGFQNLRDGLLGPAGWVFAMQTARPIFNVKALESGSGYMIEANWPDGRTERLIGVYTSPAHAAKWVNDHDDAWIGLNQPKYH